ncbi:hypothetical protein IWQ60_001348 [Tieghemiomyces parasiticus]|uniref:ER membrane protein complex subunit 6 n=1 Tax=Tieghemiomyces parasiticus TaxID=78921 RepID=A0A9W8E2M5_9FUNG|nr:hypothetical protein IWQ60_001348 [Tieghemiomyces parasiticus]
MASATAGTPGITTPVYFDPHVLANNRTLDNIQTLSCAAAGCAAGILGLAGWAGFVLYTASWSTLAALLFLLKAQSQPTRYFPSAAGIATHGIFSGLFTFVLFWTLAFNLVHVYD